MNIGNVLFFCILSALCGGDNRLVSAKVNIYAVAEGGSDSISCYMYASGSNKFFCKNQCKAEEILVKTEEVTAQNGRFSIEYKNSSSGRNILTMTISNMTKSDTGWYRFGLGNSLVPDSYCDIEVIVLQEDLLDRSSGFVRADIEGENITQGCSNTVHGKQKFLCKGDCQKEEDILIETEEDKAQNGRHSIEYIKGSHFGLYVTFTNVTKSDTGRYKCGYGRALSPDSARKFSIFVIQGPSPSPPPPETTLKPETTSWSSAAAPTTSTPSWTSRPPSASVPSASTQTPTTSTPNWTPPPPSASVPSASPKTPTTSTTKRTPRPPSASVPSASTQNNFCPLVASVSSIGFLLLVVFLLLLYIRRMRRHFRRNMALPLTYKNLASASTCEDSTCKTSCD